jgi:thiol-disulfide isomerase/thioredoxin
MDEAIIEKTKKRRNPWMLSTIGLIVILIIFLIGGPITGMFATQTSVSPEEAARRAIEFINENLVQPNTTASFNSVNEVSGFYNITFSYLDRDISVYVSKDGSYLFVSEPLDITEELPTPITPEGTIGNFLVSGDDVCEEDGKPIIYFFGSERCPHCEWEHPIINSVAENFEGLISYHENVDNEEDRDIFSEYSTGGIPTIVIGCKYYRVGSGERMGEEQEGNVLTALICSLTNNEPSDVCDNVIDLIDQIE